MMYQNLEYSEPLFTLNGVRLDTSIVLLSSVIMQAMVVVLFWISILGHSGMRKIISLAAQRWRIVLRLNRCCVLS